LPFFPIAKQQDKRYRRTPMNGITFWNVIKAFAFIALMMLVYMLGMEYLVFLVDTSEFIYTNYSYTHVLYYAVLPVVFFIYVFAIALSKVVQAGSNDIHLIKKNTVAYKLAAVITVLLALYNIACIYVYLTKMNG